MRFLNIFKGKPSGEFDKILRKKKNNRIKITVPEELLLKLKDESKASGIDMSEIVRVALWQFIGHKSQG